MEAEEPHGVVSDLERRLAVRLALAAVGEGPRPVVLGEQLVFLAVEVVHPLPHLQGFRGELETETGLMVRSSVVSFT